MANRVCEQETGSFLIIGVNPYFAAQLLDNELADRQTESCALSIFIQFLKTVEYFILILQRDTAAGVGHRKQCYIFCLFFQFQGDGALWSKFGCIDEKVD